MEAASVRTEADVEGAVAATGAETEDVATLLLLKDGIYALLLREDPLTRLEKGINVEFYDKMSQYIKKRSRDHGQKREFTCERERRSEILKEPRLVTNPCGMEKNPPDPVSDTYSQRGRTVVGCREIRIT